MTEPGLPCMAALARFFFIHQPCKSTSTTAIHAFNYLRVLRRLNKPESNLVREPLEVAVVKRLVAFDAAVLPGKTIELFGRASLAQRQ